jgi:hypothetical protein
MGSYNERLVEAGIMESGEGLVGHEHTRRIEFGADRSSTVLDGPFSETKEFLAGFWIFNCDSIDTAIEWARKAPFSDGAVLEIRKVAGPEDFGDAYTEEVAEQEDRLREKLQAR